MSQRKNYRNKKSSKGSSSAGGSSVKDQSLVTLSEMFPDWESEDLFSLLSEHQNDVEIVIDLIVNNKVSKWEPIKKESKPKKRDDLFSNSEQSHGSGALYSSSHSHTPGEHKGKHTRERQPRSEKRKEKKVPKKDSSNPASSAAVTAAATAAVTAPTSTSSASPASTIPSNSWAAALAKDNSKPKASAVSKAAQKQEEHEQPPKSLPKMDVTSGTDIEDSTAAAKAAESKSHETDPSSSNKPSSNVQATTSWASAIKPKSKPVSKPEEPKTAEVIVPVPTLSQKVEAETDNVKNNTSTADKSADVTAKATVSQNTEPAKTSVAESEVVLPQQVSNVGVSFGSLSLQDDQVADSNVVQKGEPQEPRQSLSSYGAEQNTIEATQIQSQQQPPPPSSQPQPQSQEEDPEQTYEQQYEQQKSSASSQGYEFYNQFQQSQQQFPQQAAAGTIPAQFGYPSFDYSAAYGQANQNALGSMVSPVYYNTNANSKSAGHGAGNAANGGDITNSPLVGNNAQGLHTPQQSQVPGTAPFYPNYYNYFYNTPFYGSGAGMSGTSNAYGMQQQQQQQQQQPPQSQAQAQQAQQQQHGNENGVAEGEAGSNQSAAQSAFAANQFYAQYYGNPNQFGNRGGYHYNGYPNNQQFPQNVPSNEQTEQQQNSQQPITVPSGGPQYSMPQFSGYQQYPQYGSYQDNSQYRGWY